MRKALFTAILALAPALGHAQGYPVIDNADLAQVANTVNALKNIAGLYGSVSNPASLLGVNSIISAAVGHAGAPNINSSQFATMPNGLTAQASYSGYQPMVPAQPGAAPTQASISGFQAAQKASDNAYFPQNSNTLTPAQTTAYQKSRAQGQTQALSDAQALALSMKAVLAAMPARVDQLKAAADNATDDRTDIQANTAVMIEIHQRLIDLTAIATQSLALKASAKMADMPMITSANPSTTTTNSTSTP